jgi:hypothetical protein
MTTLNTFNVNIYLRSHILVAPVCTDPVLLIIYCWGSTGATIEGLPVAGASHSDPAKRTLFTQSGTVVRSHNETNSSKRMWLTRVEQVLYATITSSLSWNCAVYAAQWRAGHSVLLSLVLSNDCCADCWAVNADSGLDRLSFIHCCHWAACFVIGWWAELVGKGEWLPFYCGSGNGGWAAEVCGAFLLEIDLGGSWLSWLAVLE